MTTPDYPTTKLAVHRLPGTPHVGGSKQAVARSARPCASLPPYWRLRLGRGSSAERRQGRARSNRARKSPRDGGGARAYASPLRHWCGSPNATAITSLNQDAALPRKGRRRSRKQITGTTQMTNTGHEAGRLPDGPIPANVRRRPTEPRSQALSPVRSRCPCAPDACVGRSTAKRKRHEQSNRSSASKSGCVAYSSRNRNCRSGINQAANLGAGGRA